MKKLRMIFSGLLGYTRSEHDGKAKLTVVVPRVLVPDVLPSRDETHPITLPHYPFLSFDARHLGESKRLPDMALKQYAERQLKYGLFLGQECLVVDVGGSGEGVHFYKNQGVTDDQQYPDPSLSGEAWLAQRRDYRWILGMDKVLPGCGKVDHDCVGDNKSALAFSRIEIHDGCVTVNRLVGEHELGGGKRAATLYKLEKIGDIGEVDRVLAEEVMIEIDIMNEFGEVRFSSHNFGGGKQAEDLVLRADGDRYLYVNVLCAELDQIIRPNNLVFDNRKAQDLVALYELSGQRPPVNLRRYPISSELTGSGGSAGVAGDRICPGVFFNV
jgi:hypothetical protein